MSRLARIDWDDEPRQIRKANRRDERAPTEKEVRQILAELRYPIAETGPRQFESTCARCGGTLRCRFYDGPTLAPVIRCRQCRASPDDLITELRITGVVARAKAHLASHPDRQPPKTQEIH